VVGRRRRLPTSAVVRTAIPAQQGSSRNGRWKRRAIRIAWFVIQTRGAAAYIRIIGYSPGAGFVLTVIVDPDDWSGVTAWKTRAPDLREYLEDRKSD
jgi:hypothetical protein